MRDYDKRDLGGYVPSTVDLNSPEIMRLAYSPEMNKHVQGIKDQRKKKSQDASMQVALEFADHCSTALKSSGRLSSGPIKLRKFVQKLCFMCDQEIYSYHVVNGKKYGDCCRGKSGLPNEERRRLNLKLDPDLPGYRQTKVKPMVDQAKKRSRQTKGA